MSVAFGADPVILSKCQKTSGGYQARGTKLPFHSGDVLVFFGDGLLEAEDTDGQRYDETQIAGLLSTLASSRKPAQSMVNIILQAGITYERAGASADRYSIADSVLDEYVNWYEMP